MFPPLSAPVEAMPARLPQRPHQDGEDVKIVDVDPSAATTLPLLADVMKHLPHVAGSLRHVRHEQGPLLPLVATYPRRPVDEMRRGSLPATRLLPQLKRLPMASTVPVHSRGDRSRMTVR